MSQLEEMMPQLTINAAKMSTLQQNLQTQVQDTGAAQKRTESNLQILEGHVKDQSAQVSQMGQSLALINQGDRGGCPPLRRSTQMEFTGLEANQDLKDKPITGLQAARLIQHALTQQVAPVCQHFNNRLEVVEAELKKLKICTAWVERDIMWHQVGQARVTLIARGLA